MHHMRLVLDMLGCQTDSRHRGIGRYSMNFTRAVAEVLGVDDSLYLLGRREPEASVCDIVRAMGATLPRNRFKTIELPRCANYFETPDTAVTARMQHAALAYGAAKLNPDIVHINSLFEWDVDQPDPRTNGARLSSVTLYDLIPLLFPKPHLENEEFARAYLHKIETLKKFDLLLAISESAKADTVKHLELPADRIVNISGACDDWFTPAEVTPDDHAKLREKYGITRPFLLYTGNLDFRKNLEGCVRAYALLPENVRRAHCLVLICPAGPADRERLDALARRCGLAPDELIVTGQISDATLLLLYRACRAFVFPSLYEGFGLPVLEAMSCGAPVIAADNSSIPEVFGRAEGLFDAGNDNSVADAMYRVLTEDGFRNDLKAWGLARATQFTWKRSAQIAVDAWRESLARKAARPLPVPDAKRLRLAFVSPMPPEPTGIADYSAELLGSLKSHYAIDVFTTAQSVAPECAKAGYGVFAAAKFPELADGYDRIVYQVGNSPFHSHMLDWMKIWPGTTVLHDFFLSSLVNYEQTQANRPGFFYSRLLASHSAEALHGVIGTDHNAARVAHPVCREIFENAEGVIMHSRHLLDLIAAAYPEGVAAPTAIVPHLRESKPYAPVTRVATRQKLGVAPDEIIISTFGHIAHTKCPEVLLEAFGKLARECPQKLRLVLVGEPEGGGYRDTFLAQLRESGLADKVTVTGFASRSLYEDWLVASDIGVQLRRHSRGETSGAVLDCFAYSLPVILNRYAGFTDYDDGIVRFIDAEADSGELVDALRELIADKALRVSRAQVATEWLRARHLPSVVAQGYANAIESFHARGHGRNPQRLLADVADARPATGLMNEFLGALAQSAPLLRPARLYVDVTQYKEEWNRGYMTGIQRVIANLLDRLRQRDAQVWPVEVNTAGNGFDAVAYDAAGKLVSTGIQVRYQQGDRFLLPEVRGDITRDCAYWRPLKRAGVEIHVILHDLLPVRLPQYFPDFAEGCHRNFLQAIALHSDVIHAFTRAVSDDMADWLKTPGLLADRVAPPRLSIIPMGANPVAEKLPETSGISLFSGDAPTFLIVGTIEPRKGHAFALDAFERLWADGKDVRLGIIGRIGWNVEDLSVRLRTHKELGKRLVFLEGASDATLVQAYREATALINPSAGEGFGLPLIEAANYGVPILATDIPVFREICGDNARYFSRNHPECLFDLIRRFLADLDAGKTVKPTGIRTSTWDDSAESLLRAIHDQGNTLLTPSP